MSATPEECLAGPAAASWSTVPDEFLLRPAAAASWSPSLGHLLLFFLALVASLLLYVRIKLAIKVRGAPFANIPVVPHAHWFSGHLRYIHGDADATSHVFAAHANEEGLTSFFLLAGASGISVLDARHARTILRQGEMRSFMPVARRHVPSILGADSLIFLEGGKPWMAQRRVVQHAFSGSAMMDYRPPVWAVARDVVASLTKMCDRSPGKGVEVDVVFLSQLFTLDVFGKVAMGYDFNCVTDRDDYTCPDAEDDNDGGGARARRPSLSSSDSGDEGEANTRRVSLRRSISSAGSRDETDANNTNNGRDGGRRDELAYVKKSQENKSVEFLLDDIIFRMRCFRPEAQFYWIPCRRNREQKRHTRVVNDLLAGIIQQRKDELASAKTEEDRSANDDGGASNDDDGAKKKKKRRENMLTLFIQKNEKLSAQSLAESMKTLLIAGYETTSVSISMALYNLSQHPRCQERCADEVRRIFAARGDDAAVVREEEFKYLRAALTESMRLSATVLLTQRRTKREIRLGTTVVPEGTRVVLPLSHILTDERNFERAAEFCPERWVAWDAAGGTWAERDASREEKTGGASPGPKSSNPAHAAQNAHAETIAAGDVDNFVAFSHGVRDCVGKRMAWLETTVFVAVILRDFAVDYDSSRPPLEMKRRLVTYYPHELPIVFRKR